MILLKGRPAKSLHIVTFYITYQNPVNINLLCVLILLSSAPQTSQWHESYTSDTLRISTEKQLTARNRHACFLIRSKGVSKCWGNSTCASLRPRTSTTGMSLRLPCKRSATGNSVKHGKAAATTTFSLRPQLLKKENRLFWEKKRMHQKNQAPHPVILNTFCAMRWDPLVYKAVWVRQQRISSVACRCVTALQWCSTAQFCLFYYQRHRIQQELHNNHARVHYFNPCTDLLTFYLNMYIDW